MAPKKLFKIGEVIRYSGVKRQTLHNYTMMGIIREAERTESGHRLYDESVFARLEKIAMLRRHRSLREVQELLAKEDEEALKKEAVSPGKN
jgi:DNA-binding transcriptional MerR regulator